LAAREKMRIREDEEERKKRKKKKRRKRMKKKRRRRGRPVMIASYIYSTPSLTRMHTQTQISEPSSWPAPASITQHSVISLLCALRISHY